MAATPRGPSVADFMTPSRSDASLDGVHANTEDALRREYESYKLKTRDWQNKVRERDLKMRAQLQSATDLVQAKDAELEACLKRVAAFDEVRHALHTLQTQHDSVQGQTEQLTRENAALKSDVRKAKALQTDLEDELQRRVGEVKELRVRIGALEDAVDAAELASTGLHRVLEGGRRGGRLRPSVKVLHRIDVGTATYCYAVPTEDPVESGAWIRQDLLPHDHNLNLPETVSALMEERCVNAVRAATQEFEAARQSDCVEFEQRLAAAEVLANQRVASLSSAHEAERQAWEVQAEHTLGALRGELAQLKATETRLRVEELPAALSACRQECASASDALVKQLRGDIETLQAYKSKAQVAMRHAAQHAAGAEGNDNLRKALEGEFKNRVDAALAAQAKTMSEGHATEIASLRNKAEQASSTAAALETELSVCREVIAKHEAAIAASQQREDALRQRAASAPQAPLPETASAPPMVAPTVMPKQTATASCQTNVPPPHPSPTAMRSDEARHVAAHGQGTELPTPDPPSGAGGGHFSFESMLSTLGAATPRESAEVERLRQQLRQHQHVIQRHREELRDVALREKSILEQDALLKEQIRELERAALRTKDVTEGLDYMKNVVMKVLTCREPAIRKHLMPVISEVLHLSPAERSELMSTCGDAT